MVSYRELAEFALNQDLLNQCIDLSEQKLPVFMQEFGYDFRRLRTGILDEAEFKRLVNKGFRRSNVVREAASRLLNIFNEVLDREKLYQRDITALTLDDLDNLQERINFEVFLKSLYFQKNKRFLDEEVIHDFIFFRTPYREDFMQSRVIRPCEYWQVTQRYGLAAVLHSIDPSPFQTRLLNRIQVLQTSLEKLDTLDAGLSTDTYPSTDTSLRTDTGPKSDVSYVKKHHPHTYKEARILFKRYEWAVMDLCTDTIVKRAPNFPRLYTES